MEFWSALLGAVVGALAGGGVTYWVNVAQYKRQRRESAMESFLTLATDTLASWDIQDTTRHVQMGSLEKGAMLLDLYAGDTDVSSGAWQVVWAERAARWEWDENPAVSEVGSKLWLDWMEKSWTAVNDGLTNYQRAMRKRLGLKPEPPKPASGQASSESSATNPSS